MNISKLLLRRLGISLRALPKRNASTQDTATFNTKLSKLHRLSEGPATSVTLTRPEALEYYTNMVMGRKLEAEANVLYKAKKIRGFCHLYSGQEAVAVGIKAVMRPQDATITSYRCHLQTALFNKDSAYGVLAELLGKETGNARGKGGSMHMYGKQLFGGNGIVGGQVPLGAGISFAMKYSNTDAVCFTLYGDGAANNGQVSEVFNISMLHSFPCVFVCENNLFGMGTANKRAAYNTDYYTRGDHMPGLWIDGMDVLAVREGAKFAQQHCLSGKGPILIEAETYRYFGHSLSDPGISYRSREQIQEVRQTRDPITLFKDKILGANLVTPEEVKDIDSQIKNVVEKASKKAQDDKEPSVDTLTMDVYVKYDYKIRVVNPFAEVVHKSTGNKFE